MENMGKKIKGALLGTFAAASLFAAAEKPAMTENPQSNGKATEKNVVDGRTEALQEPRDEAGFYEAARNLDSLNANKGESMTDGEVFQGIRNAEEALSGIGSPALHPEGKSVVAVYSGANFSGEATPRLQSIIWGLSNALANQEGTVLALSAFEYGPVIDELKLQRTEEFDPATRVTPKYSQKDAYVFVSENDDGAPGSVEVVLFGAGGEVLYREKVVALAGGKLPSNYGDALSAVAKRLNDVLAKRVLGNR